MVKRIAQRQGVSKMGKHTKETKTKSFTETNRHSIPPHLDEDIDDDLAFNSEDEELYGHFFNKVNQAGNTDHNMEEIDQRNSDNAMNDYYDNNDDRSEEISSSVLSKNKDKNKKKMHSHDKHRSSKASLKDSIEEKENTDCNVEYLDLSDMLDISLQREKGEQRKCKQSRKETSDVVKSKKLGATKKRRSARVTEATESLYENINEVKSTHNKESRKLSEQFHTSISKLLEESRAKEANAGVKQRLERTLYNKQNLLSVDEDEITKTRITRKEVREVVQEDLQKYAPTLWELNSSKHIRFPLSAPESNPVPSSLGGIVSASSLSSAGENSSNNNSNNHNTDARSGDSGVSNKTSMCLQTSESASRLTNRIASLLDRAGLSAKNMEESVIPNRSNTLGTADKDSSDFVSFSSANSNANNVRNSEKKGKRTNKLVSTSKETTDVPSTGYLIKLKSMLASENSRRKRFNKIKSKTYRRILRKEKEHERERRHRAFELLHPEIARKRLAEKLSHARAHERVTQKHKNTSMWVRHVKRFGDKDADTKDALNEQLHLHQILMQKAEEEAGMQLRTSNELTPSVESGFSVNNNNERIQSNHEKNANQYNTNDMDDMVDEETVDELLYEALPSESNVDDATISKSNTEHSLWQGNKFEMWKEKEEYIEEMEVDTKGRHSNQETEDVLANSQRVSALDDLLQMKFMKVARERQEKEYQEEMQELKREVAEYCKNNGITRDALLKANNKKEPQWQRYQPEQQQMEESNIEISDLDVNNENYNRISLHKMENKTNSNYSANDNKDEELHLNIADSNDENCPPLLVNNGHRKFAANHHSLEEYLENDVIHHSSFCAPTISNDINDENSVLQRRNKRRISANLEVTLHKQKGIEIPNDKLESNASVAREVEGTSKKKATEPLEKMEKIGVHSQGKTVTDCIEEESKIHDEFNMKVATKKKSDSTLQSSTLLEQGGEVFAPHRNASNKSEPCTTSYISLNAKALIAAKKKKSQVSYSVEDHINNSLTINSDSLRKAQEQAHNSEMSQQEYLIARAFAHDDVDDDFVEQKNAQVNLIMKPEDVNSNLPGWGEWGGSNPLLNKRHNEKRAHVAAQKEIERSFLLKSRADAKLSHVIINHDGVELVPDRMTLHMIPRPFSNPTEFARSLRQPTGPEWTSSLTFKEMVQPRVEVRKGQAIDPLDLSLHTRKQKTKRRKITKSNV